MSYLIIGNGSHACEIAELLENFLKKKSRLTSLEEELELLGSGRINDSKLYIGVGDPKIRVAIIERWWTAQSLHFQTARHPNSYVSKTSVISDGCTLQFGTVLSSFTHLEEGVLLNWNVSVGHHTKIGIGTVVNPGATIAGYCQIGTGVLIGSGAQVLQGITIGDYAIIGSGAVVTKDVPPRKCYVGIPAKEIGVL